MSCGYFSINTALVRDTLFRMQGPLPVGRRPKIKSWHSDFLHKRNDVEDSEYGPFSLILLESWNLAFLQNTTLKDLSKI